MNGKSSYPKEILIGDLLWTVRFKERMMDSADGWCVYEKLEIQIKNSLPNDDKFKTFIHECVHALDEFYEIGLTHKQVYKLEIALSEFLIDNGFDVFKILFEEMKMAAKKKPVKKPKPKPAPKKPC